MLAAHGKSRVNEQTGRWHLTIFQGWTRQPTKEVDLNMLLRGVIGEIYIYTGIAEARNGGGKNEQLEADIVS